jgi:hypothetical protein
VVQKNRLSLVAKPSVAVLEVTPSPVVFSKDQSASSSAIALGSLPAVASTAALKATDLSAVVIVAENGDSVAAAEVKEKEKVKL